MILKHTHTLGLPFAQKASCEFELLTDISCSLMPHGHGNDSFSQLTSKCVCIHVCLRQRTNGIFKSCSTETKGSLVSFCDFFFSEVRFAMYFVGCFQPHQVLLLLDLGCPQDCFSAQSIS